MALPEYNEKTLLVQAAALPPREAIEFFRAKGFKITWKAAVFEGAPQASSAANFGTLGINFRASKPA